jgi:hypothetical protein
MEVSIESNHFSRFLTILMKEAKHVRITTMTGADHRLFEPIRIGHDYLSFNTSARGSETTVIRREAIASITVEKHSTTEKGEPVGASLVTVDLLSVS